LSVPDPKKTRTANLMLAGVTGLSLTCLVFAATAFGPPGPVYRYAVLAVAVAGLYLLINRFLLKRAARPPLIQLDSPITWVFAMALPLIIMICALAPVIWHGKDFGLAIIVGGVWFGQTLESAFRKVTPE
jgi:hypothetical protein